MTDRDDPRRGVPPWSGTAHSGHGLGPSFGLTAPGTQGAQSPGPAAPLASMQPQHHQQHSPPPSPAYGGASGHQAQRSGPPPGYGGYGGQAQPGYGSPPPGGGYGGPPSGGGYGQQQPYGVPPPGYGAPPPGLAPPPPGAPMTHSPGPGAVVGLVGWALLAACFFALPFIKAPEGVGDDATFMDLRDAATAEVPDLDSTTLDPSLEPGLSPSDPSTLDPSLAPPGDPSSLDPSGLNGVEPPAGFDAQGLQGQVPGPSTGGEVPPIGPEVSPPTSSFEADSGAEFVADYVDFLWVAVLVYVALGVVFATLFVPKSHGGRMVCGFFGGGLIGLLFNALDNRGTWAPKATGALAVVVGGGLHLYALSEIFSGDFAPDPGLGVYAGGFGIVLALVGVLMGTKQQPARY